MWQGRYLAGYPIRSRQQTHLRLDMSEKLNHNLASYQLIIFGIESLQPDSKLHRDPVGEPDFPDAIGVEED